jgi:hypothetical protein
MSFDIEIVEDVIRVVSKTSYDYVNNIIGSGSSDNLKLVITLQRFAHHHPPTLLFNHCNQSVQSYLHSHRQWRFDSFS